MRPYRYRPSVMAAVDVESLTITYGKVTAVDDVSFQARAGEVTCILGPNGAGKTSTIEALEGLRRPASGRLSVVGLDPQTEHFVLTERMGVMLQEGGIHPGVTVRAALRHAAALYDDPLDVRGLVDQLGLGGLERRTYRQLSGGEQRRLALALALVGRPQVAFLDEPTSGVDPAGRQVIRQVISDLRNEGVTVLLTTHDLDEAERVADRVIIIDRGRLLAEGTVAELTRTPDGESRVSFRAPPGLDRMALADHVGADVTESAPGDYTVAAPPTPAVIAAITAWLAQHDLPLGDLRAGRQRLEDVYLRLTSREGGGRRPRRRASSAEPDSPAGADARSDAAGDPDDGGVDGIPPATDMVSPAVDHGTARDGGDVLRVEVIPPPGALPRPIRLAPRVPAPAPPAVPAPDDRDDPDTWDASDEADHAGEPGERARRTAEWWSPPWSDPAGGPDTADGPGGADTPRRPRRRS